MAIDINGTILTGGTSLTATDVSSNKVFQQLSTGQTLLPTTAAGASLTPLFSVGTGVTAQWTNIVTGVQPAGYTGGLGYLNVGGCYNTSTYRFTAPWTGLYLFKQSFFIYQNVTTVTSWVEPFFLVNGSTTVRKVGNPLRMRLYGRPSSYYHDTDMCEMIYLTAGDYVSVYFAVNGAVQSYDTYNHWSGSYIGN